MATIEPTGAGRVRDKAPVTQASGPLLPPPTSPASASVITMMIVSRLGFALALQLPITAGLALKLQTLVAPDALVGTLALVTSLGAFSALFFDPLFGRLSDRTTSRFGRRRPWLVLGAAGMLPAMLLMAVAPNAVVLGVGWVLTQMLANAAVGAHTATLADQLPARQRGKVSGAIGIVNQVGTLGAAYAASLLGANMLLFFLVPAGVGFILAMGYVLVLPDRQLPARPPREGGLLLALTTFWVNPIKNPDFALAWWSRFLLVLANFMFTTFRLIWIQQEFGLTPQKAAAIMSTGVLCYVISVIVAGQIAGWISDMVGRRKPFIIGSALIFAVGIYFLVHASTPGAFFFAEVILGIGFGIYVAIDLALVIDVLPNPDDAGKDLGVFNIAMAGPQVLAPAVAAAVIGIGGGQNFDLMFTVAAVIAAIGAVLILFVRKVR